MASSKGCRESVGGDGHICRPACEDGVGVIRIPGKLVVSVEALLLWLIHGERLLGHGGHCDVLKVVDGEG
jgi:hypothetical protein